MLIGIMFITIMFFISLVSIFAMLSPEPSLDHKYDRNTEHTRKVKDTIFTILLLYFAGGILLFISNLLGANDILSQLVGLLSIILNSYKQENGIVLLVRNMEVYKVRRYNSE